MTAADPDNSLWAQYLAANGLPADTPMPTSLDARRAKARPDGLAHCARCGGTLFTGTIAMDERGMPVAVLKPQKCVGCGAFHQTQWPPD